MPRIQLSELQVESMRQRVSSSAMRIYLSEGLEGVSFRRIADEMSVSPMALYRYFENKEALLARMRADALNRFGNYIDEYESRADDSLTRVLAIAEGYIAFARSHPAEYLLIFATHQPAVDRHPELLEARIGLFDRVVAAVQRCIDEGRLKGEARELSHHVWVALHGLLTLHAAGQLLHGMNLDEIVGPLVQRLLGASAVESPARGSAHRKRRIRT